MMMNGSMIYDMIYHEVMSILGEKYKNINNGSEKICATIEAEWEYFDKIGLCCTDTSPKENGGGNY